MDPPNSMQICITKPRIVDGTPPKGCQPQYLKDKGEGSSTQRVHNEMEKVGRCQEDRTGRTPVRRAIFRSVLDPTKEKEKRGKRAFADGGLRDYCWRTSKTHGIKIKEKEHHGPKAMWKQGKPKDKDPLGKGHMDKTTAMATSKKMCRPEWTHKKASGVSIGDYEEWKKNLPSPLKPRRAPAEKRPKQRQPMALDKENQAANLLPNRPKRQEKQGKGDEMKTLKTAMKSKKNKKKNKSKRNSEEKKEQTEGGSNEKPPGNIQLQGVSVAEENGRTVFQEWELSVTTVEMQGLTGAPPSIGGDQAVGTIEPACEMKQITMGEQETQKSEEEETENQGCVIMEGPRTKEEQYHHDILEDELEWKEPQTEVDTAALVAEVIGMDSFEMEVTV